jgi:glycine/D-amino acid oxidase-like deaminating enzyme
VVRPIDGFQGAKALPDRVDVAVIGGGIVGVSTALVLAERGISVAVIEKGVIGGEQSSRNWGLCRQTRRHPAEMPLMQKTIEMWKGMNARTGHETGFVQKGLLFTCDTEADVAAFGPMLREAREAGLDTRLLSSREASQMLPGITRTLAGAIYTPSDGSAEPQHAAVSIAKGAAAKGAVIVTGCAVRMLDIEGGRVTGVLTEKGLVRCQTAVLASGIWSRLFLGNHGISLPSLNVHTSVQATEPMDGPPDQVVYGSDFGFRRRLDGGWNLGQLSQTTPIVPDSFLLGLQFSRLLRTYMGGFTMTIGREFIDAARTRKRWRFDEVTPFENTRIIEPAIHRNILAKTRARLEAVAPWFRNAKIRYQWTGVIDMIPDELPVISHVPRLPGLVLATGFSGHGFGIGPGAGQLVADVATGATPIVDPRPFDFARLDSRARAA